MVARLSFKNRKSFELALNDFIEDVVPDAHLALQKKIAFDLLGRIIDKNPVGNPSNWKGYPPRKPPAGYVGGRSRSNWQVSITTPGLSSVVGIDKTGSTAETAGLAAMTGAKPYGTIWIYNNVTYIRRLEEGWSKQARTGMVAVSLAEIEAGLGAG